MMLPTVNWVWVAVQRSWRKEAIQQRKFNFYTLTDRHQSGYCVVGTHTGSGWQCLTVFLIYLGKQLTIIVIINEIMYYFLD